MSISRPLLRRLLIDGLALGAVFATVALASIWTAPELWLDNYPPDIRAAVGGSLEVSALEQAAHAVVLFAVLLTGLAVALRRLDADLGGLTAPTAGLYVFGLFLIVNAIDVLVVDWLFFMRQWRDRVTLPGTAGLPGYDDHLFHLRASFLTPAPWLGALALAALSAVGWWWFVSRRRRDDSPEPRSGESTPGG